MSSVGEYTAFPITLEGASHYGMTYRQWLAGMGLAGGATAQQALARADAVIRLLDAEPGAAPIAA